MLHCTLQVSFLETSKEFVRILQDQNTAYKTTKDFLLKGKRNREWRWLRREDRQWLVVAIITALHCCGAERRLKACARSPHAPLIATTWPDFGLDWPTTIVSQLTAQCPVHAATSLLLSAQCPVVGWPGVPQAFTRHRGRVCANS